jgi:hypothetical protein
MGGRSACPTAHSICIGYRDQWSDTSYCYPRRSNQLSREAWRTASGVFAATDVDCSMNICIPQPYPPVCIRREGSATEPTLIPPHPPLDFEGPEYGRQLNAGLADRLHPSLAAR